MAKMSSPVGIVFILKPNAPLDSFQSKTVSNLQGYKIFD